MKQKRNILVTGLAIILAAATLLGGATYAYLRSETDDVVNAFSANQVTVSLSETTGNDYNIIPGTVQAKDPTVTVNNTVDAYAYVVVTDQTDGFVSYTVESGWQPLEGWNMENIAVYYRSVPKDAGNKVFGVLQNNQVSYDAALANSDMLTVDGRLKAGIRLTFSAFAVQQAGFDSAKAAFESAHATASTADQLKEAFAAGKAVVMTENTVIGTDTQLSFDEYNIADHTVLNLNGNTISSIHGSAVFQGENAMIKNGTFVSTNGSSYPLFIGNGSKDTSITVENVTVDGGINVFSSKTILRDVTADASNGIYYAVWADNGAEIIIESGTYIGGNEGGHLRPAVNSSHPANPEVDGPPGIITITGGLFNTDVSDYVAQGYHVEPIAQENGETWYRVVAD